jgi:hypothetical protein
MAEREVWVLTRETLSDHESDVRVTAVYPSYEALSARVDRIAKANRQYPMRPHRYRDQPPMAWTVGPEEDEGLFGNKPVYLRAHKTTLHETV